MKVTCRVLYIFHVLSPLYTTAMCPFLIVNCLFSLISSVDHGQCVLVLLLYTLSCVVVDLSKQTVATALIQIQMNHPNQNWQDVFVVHIQMTNVSMWDWASAASRNRRARQTFWAPTSTVRSSAAPPSWSAPPRCPRWPHSDSRTRRALTTKRAANRATSILPTWRPNRPPGPPRSPSRLRRHPTLRRRRKSSRIPPGKEPLSRARPTKDRKVRRVCWVSAKWWTGCKLKESRVILRINQISIRQFINLIHEVETK